MKTFCKTILIIGFVLINTFGLQAQIADNKLNQVELMKNFFWSLEM